MNTLQEFTAHHLYMRYAIDEHPDDRAFAISAQTVSEQCGFGEHSTFFRAYVKLFGCSPKSDSESIQAV